MEHLNYTRKVITIVKDKYRIPSEIIDMIISYSHYTKNTFLETLQKQLNLYWILKMEAIHYSVKMRYKTVSIVQKSLPGNKWIMKTTLCTKCNDYYEFRFYGNCKGNICYCDTPPPISGSHIRVASE